MPKFVWNPFEMIEWIEIETAAVQPVFGFLKVGHQQKAAAAVAASVASDEDENEIKDDKAVFVLRFNISQTLVHFLSLSLSSVYA